MQIVMKPMLPKMSMLYLLIAGLVDLGMAFMPIWSLTPGSSFVEHAVQSFGAVVQETATLPREFVAIFWLPFTAGISCFGAMIMAYFVPNGPVSARAVLIVPLMVTIGALAYFLVVRADIHVLVVSLLPLAGAWWEHHKSKRAKQAGN